MDCIEKYAVVTSSCTSTSASVRIRASRIDCSNRKCWNGCNDTALLNKMNVDLPRVQYIMPTLRADVSRCCYG